MAPRHSFTERLLWALAVALAIGLPRAAPAQTAANAQTARAAGPLSASAMARAERQRISARVWRSEDVLRSATDASDTPPWSNDPALIEMGRRLFVEGRRADGRPLVGARLEGQVRISGANAACSLCHRRSGLGAVEGTNQIAPISGRYLFDQDRRALVTMNLRARKAFNQRHDPYTLATLGGALRAGVHESGRELDELMPRYELSDREVLALASYLRHLSNAWSPGVSDRRVRLATIVTPDVTAPRRRIFLDTIQAIAAQKNGNIVRGQRSMSSGAEMTLQTDRQWDLAVWELSGAPQTWRAQLEQFQARDEAFAVVSGIGAGEWTPVHRFCEERAVPCWFPSVGAAPVESAMGFYSIYFSAGAGLEAEVLAQRFAAAARSGQRPGRVLQVHAQGGAVSSTVERLKQALRRAGIAQRELDLSAGRAALSRELAALRPQDSVVFWLTAEQAGVLQDLPVPAGAAYFSASLGNAERIPLNAQWLAEARMVYPYQLPAQRQRGLTYFKEWLRIRGLPLEDEVLQSEVHFAMSYFNDTLVDMLDNVHRDYLLERGESMLSRRELAKAEDEARELSLPRTNLVDPAKPALRVLGQRPLVPRSVPHAVSNRPMQSTRDDLAAAEDLPDGVSRTSGAAESTNVYPRLSLGQRQRHASKGAYIVRLIGDEGAVAVRAESDWIVP